MAFDWKKKKLDAVALYKAGNIIVRPDQFWRVVQVFVLQTTDDEMLASRIKACIPKGIPISYLHAERREAYFYTKEWQAKLVKLGKNEAGFNYEFWFSDPLNDTNTTTILQMNALATAVEKAFLLTDSFTYVHKQYATRETRDFNIGKAADSDSPVFAVGQWVNYGLSWTSPAVALKAIKTGSEALRELRDVSETSRINEDLSLVGGVSNLLLTRYINTPALPHSLQSDAQKLFGVASPQAYGGQQSNPAFQSTVGRNPAAPVSQGAAPSNYNETTREVHRSARFCSECGTPHEEDQNYCVNCGMKL